MRRTAESAVRAAATAAAVALAIAATVAVAAALAGRQPGSLLGPGAASASTLRGSLVEDSYSSRATRGRLRFALYLPPGYAEGNRRYPVIYFLHGLPADETAYRDIGYVGRALAAQHLAAIVVGVQGARSGDTDPEYLDWGPGRNWETAIATELPRVVDARYRTIATRSGRAVIGTSAGGYGAAVIGLHHLDSFSVIESWSGYFHPTDPDGVRPLPRGSDIEDSLASAHSLIPTLRGAFARQPTFLAFYVGDRDTNFLGENVALAGELARANVPFTFEIYKGGHSRSLWEGQAPRWLWLAVARLAPAT